MTRFLQRNRSVLIALGITMALTLWLLSGTGATGSARDPSLEAPRVNRPAITRVRVKVMESRPVTRDVIIYGKIEAARSVTLRAEIDARVVAIGARRGARVRKGDMIVRLDVRDREARLQQARALVELGVKSVGGDGIVVFHSIDIVRTDADGVWVTGLPERVRVIIVGQGFVREGDRVEARAGDQGA